jgi:spore maturation protein CgeB
MTGPVLVWYPGASVAVKDVADGLMAGLEANGIRAIPYRLDAHLDMAGWALKQAYAERQKEGVPVTAPTAADCYYYANMGVLERALRYDCEWVVMVSGLFQHPDYAVMLRRSGRKVALLCTESPYQTRHERYLAGFVDHVFVNERSMVAPYREVNPSTSYLGAAWNPGRHVDAAQPEDAKETAHDVVFVGTGFIERIHLLERMDWTGIDLGVYGTWDMVEDGSPLLAHLPVVDGEPKLAQSIPNSRTAALYRRAKVGLNLHRTAVDYDPDTAHISGAESLNPRCYELAACGKFFISDYRPEARDVFAGALPTFRDAREATEMVRLALKDATWRADVAEVCRELVQRHSWRERAAQALEAMSAREAVAA